jgi:DNA-binding MarR family transcriptional regulator
MDVSTRPDGGRQHLAETVMKELRALSTAQDRLDQYAMHRFGINRTDLRALDLIGQAGVISPTALAVALGMSTGATSTVLDRLEAAGYARRQPDPGHRRRTLVRQTPRAEKLGEEIFGPVIGGTLSEAAAYPDAALVSIAEFLSAHRALLNGYLAEVSPAAGKAGSPLSGQAEVRQCIPGESGHRLNAVAAKGEHEKPVRLPVSWFLRVQVDAEGQLAVSLEGMSRRGGRRKAIAVRKRAIWWRPWYSSGASGMVSQASSENSAIGRYVAATARLRSCPQPTESPQPR